MFPSGKLIDDYKNELMNMYGYGDSLAEDIAMMASSIVDSLGIEYESVVLDAVLKTKVKTTAGKDKRGIKKTILDVLREEGMTGSLEMGDSYGR